MKLLKDILYKCSIDEMAGNTHLAIEKITFDSRAIVKHTLFIAIKGTLSDGHAFIDKAIESGANAIVCEELPSELNEDVTYIKVKNSAETLGIIASNFYDNPSSELKLIGITGTNGKTTVASLLHQLFLLLDNKAGLLSTVQILVNKEVYPATHTTPDPITINNYLRKMVDEGCKYCFMEVSSHGLVQNRVSGLEFDGAAFTNITHDHLDYHKTFTEYIHAKQMLFNGLSKKAFALINVDDRNSGKMTEKSAAKLYSYALKSGADYKTKILESQLNGTLLSINNQEVWTQLTGDFNASNLTAVYAIADLMGLERLQLLTAISTLKPVSGRFQYVISKSKITAIVDYAHTPDALKNVLSTISKLRTGNEKVITIVGCGGDRDKTKRPEMARIAAELSNQIVLTSDNPRTEDPEAILNDMEAGLDPSLKAKSLRISDRHIAIKTANTLAQPGDIILIAGKGHETYQDIAGVKHHFDDMEEIKSLFKESHT
jgi:UDP-N-acetylmuramoyl-L-alanyl-D-glutamate--2,6-diaminopimelate ligase